MGRLIASIKKRARLWTQICFAAFTNGYAAGFLKGNIYKGQTKKLCLPGLNCYSCPGSLGACPIGALQAVIGDRGFKLAFYVVGFLMFFGAVFGRFICGWLCPFGLVEDLMYKIPFVKKLRALPGDKYLKYLKYVILVLFVIILPLFVLDIVGQGQPWFCKYICPSGTLFGGVPLIAASPALRSALGWLFAWKAALLVLLLLLSVVVYRPFCRYLCPLGAVYGIFNRASLYRISLDSEKCTSCGACRRACKLDIAVYKTQNSAECIRCGACSRACPHGALAMGFCAGKQGK